MKRSAKRSPRKSAKRSPRRSAKRSPRRSAKRSPRRTVTRRSVTRRTAKRSPRRTVTRRTATRRTAKLSPKIVQEKLAKKLAKKEWKEALEMTDAVYKKKAQSAENYKNTIKKIEERAVKKAKLSIIKAITSNPPKYKLAIDLMKEIDPKYISADEMRKFKSIMKSFNI